jgi:transposase-like protein
LVLPPWADDPTGIEDLRGLAENLVEEARAKGIALTGEGGLLPTLVSRVLESGLQAELTDHLGYETHAIEGRGSGNSRNGSFTKTVTTEIGTVPIQVPRDRNGTFDPQLVPHGTRRLDGLEAQVISLYASGLTTGEIQGHLAEIYGTSVSKDTVSRITDAIVADMEAWQSRPLDTTWFPVMVANTDRPGGPHAEVRVEQELAGGEGTLLRADPPGLVQRERV